MIEELNPIKEPTIPSPSAPSPPSPPPFGIPPTPGPGSNLIIKIIAVVVTLGVVGAGTVLATRVWDPPWNPFRPSPEKVVEQMISNMAELKAFHTETQVSAQVPMDTKGSNYFNYLADIDRSDPKNPKIAGDLEIKLETEGMQISVGIGFKTIGEVFYFNLTKIPTLPFFPSELASNLKNQWIKIDKDTFKDLWGAYIPDIEQQLEKTKEQQAKIIERLEEIIGKRKFYYVKKELSNEKINGKTAYHYLLALDNKELKEIILELPEVFGGTYSSGEMIAAEEEFLKGLDEFFEKFGEFTGEVWIGKKDKLLYKVAGEKTIDLSAFGIKEYKGESIVKGMMKIKVEINFSNFDKPITIESPKEFKSLEEILTPLFQMFLGGSVFLPASPSIYPQPSISSSPSYEQLFIGKGFPFFQASILDIFSNIFK